MPPRTRQQTAPPLTTARTPLRSSTRLTRRTNRSLSVDPSSSRTTESPSPTLSIESESEATVIADTPTPTPEEDDDLERTPRKKMHTLRPDPHGLRGRNVEDLAELEEKGLLRAVTPESDAESSSPRRRKNEKVKDKLEKQVRVERVLEQSFEDDGGGLNNPRDRKAFAFLVILYLLQGIPLGLTFGTLPFLLKSKLSYSQLGIFSLATWPYSLKLLWSPIVDAWFVPKWGRRKSWIVPVQGILGMGLWIIGGRVEKWMEADVINVKLVTAVFGSLIMAAATQDIAVDGWALTLLSQPNLSYASTAQTIGIGIGNALSFTVFLAFNSVEFSNKYFRSTPLDYGLVSLGGYIRFWAAVFIISTAAIAYFKTEDPVSEDDPDMDVKKVYKVMWSIFRLKNIQAFLLVHLTCKIGFQVNDSVTGLKLLEKGLSKEDLAVAVLLDFPAQMIAGWLVAKWSRPAPSKHPLTGTGEILRPWIMAFWARLGMALVATGVVYAFPRSGQVGNGYLAVIVATTLLSSLTSTIQFIGISAFHTHIADPLVGGTFMTLLNTISNLGGTLPKPFILRAVDYLTVGACSTSGGFNPALGNCVTEESKKACSVAGGHCVITRDGYYIMSFICVGVGAVLLVKYILPTVKRLQALPMSAWRVKIPA